MALLNYSIQLNNVSYCMVEGNDGDTRVTLNTGNHVNENFKYCQKRVPYNKSSDEATKSTGWKCRENVKHKYVSQMTASYHCEFCRNFSKHYFPNTKFTAKDNGHYVPSRNFYSILIPNNSTAGDCVNFGGSL